MVILTKIIGFLRRRQDKTLYTTVELETWEERRIRWRSIRIVYFIMLLACMGLANGMAGIWPYLNKLDASASKEDLGIVVAAGALGQMIFSPIFGFWGNRSKSASVPMILAMPVAILASVGYASLELFPTHSVLYWMTLCRFLLGGCAASSVVARSYISEATTLKERTGVISMISLYTMVGMMVGQALQGVVTPLGDDGILIFGGVLSLNMYSAIGWISAIINLAILLVLVWPGLFSEQRIAVLEATRNRSETSSEKESPKMNIKLDYIAVWSLLIGHLVTSTEVFQSLGTSIVMDQFAWSREDSLKFMSLLMTSGGVINIISVSAIKPLCRRFDERSVFVYGGFLLMAVGLFLYVPIGGDHPQLMHISEIDINGTTALGCPVTTQTWCATVPAMKKEQIVVAFLLFSIGISMSITLCLTLLSKTLGPRPQGVWIGTTMGLSCLSRVIGPIIMSSVYVHLGPVWTFSLTAGTTTIYCIWLRLVRARLVPPRAADECTRHVQPQELQKLWRDDSKTQIVAISVGNKMDSFS